MKIGDFVETYKGKARMVAVDRVKAMLFGSQNAQITLPPFILSRGVYNNSPMKDFTIIDITFDGRIIYLDFNGDELLKPTEPPIDVMDFLSKLDKKYEDFIKEKNEDERIKAEVKKQIESNPTMKAVKEYEEMKRRIAEISARINAEELGYARGVALGVIDVIKGEPK